MNSEHIQTGTLREYLLRTLSDNEAEAIEKRYFTDGSFFKELRAAEVELISDYLDGRLNERDLGQFEQRYLQVQTLRQLVEDVRSRRGAGRHASRRRLLQVALAGALGCVAILGIAIFRYNHANKASTPAQTASVELSPAEISLILTPGVTKGSTSSTPVLTLPNPPHNVLMVAELPGQSSSATYTARLFNVDLEGLHKEVWTASGLRSTRKDEAQRVIVELPSGSIAPGDYILELKMEGGHASETYVFRAKPSRNQDGDR